MIAIKTIGNSLCKYFISTSDGESKKQMVAVIIGSILLGTSHSFNFFVDWLFEKYLCRYKEKISINCLRKIFNSDDLKINDISPNKTAHIIEDGGEAMAEVSKSLLLDLPNVILKFLCDTIIIFFTDDSGSKKIYTIFFVGGLLLLALKLYIITYSVKYVKPLVLEGLERDKIFHEIMDRDKIIRSFCVDEEYLKKLRLKG
ncbi:abcB5 [Ecytonucleospora hepatopenaei]|uniref:AbcB5 n=1 Tax=Ecytonucleospora hepatopenaei TaxID=646526 RepID=A0A1W0E357_9MICR|nr:abcB5 [Ecytonucleospora hepatopenaei]